MKIPPGLLSQQALRGVVLEFVSREGTDYGHRDYDMESKIAQVYDQLERGEVVILADAESGSCNIVTAKEADRALEAMAWAEREQD